MVFTFSIPKNSIMKRHENPLIFMGGSVRGPQEKTLCILRHLRRAAAMNRVVNITGLFHFFPVKLTTIGRVKLSKSGFKYPLKLRNILFESFY